MVLFEDWGKVGPGGYLRMQLCMQRVKATSQLGEPLVEIRH